MPSIEPIRAISEGFSRNTHLHRSNQSVAWEQIPEIPAPPAWRAHAWGPGLCIWGCSSVLETLHLAACHKELIRASPLHCQGQVASRVNGHLGKHAAAELSHKPGDCASCPMPWKLSWPGNVFAQAANPQLVRSTVGHIYTSMMHACGGCMTSSTRKYQVRYHCKTLYAHIEVNRFG